MYVMNICFDKKKFYLKFFFSFTLVSVHNKP